MNLRYGLQQMKIAVHTFSNIIDNVFKSIIEIAIMTKKEKSRLKELNDKIKNYNKQYNPCPGSGVCPGLDTQEYFEWTRLSFMEIEEIRKKNNTKQTNISAGKVWDFRWLELMAWVRIHADGGWWNP